MCNSTPWRFQTVQMRPSINLAVKDYCYWSCAIKLGTWNSLLCAVELWTLNSELETQNAFIWPNKFINVETRSELSVEIGTRKLGQGRSELSHVDTLNQELRIRNSHYWTQNSYLTTELTEGFICTVWKRQSIELHIFKY